MIESGCFDELFINDVSNLNQIEEEPKSNLKKNKLLNFFTRHRSSSITSIVTASTFESNQNVHSNSIFSRFFDIFGSRSTKQQEDSLPPVKVKKTIKERDFKSIENIDRNKLCVWTIEEELSSHVVSD